MAPKQPSTGLFVGLNKGHVVTKKELPPRSFDRKGVADGDLSIVATHGAEIEAYKSLDQGVHQMVGASALISTFQSDKELDNRFAVLVPCYRSGCKEVEDSSNELLSAIKNLTNEFSSVLCE